MLAPTISPLFLKIPVSGATCKPLTAYALPGEAAEAKINFKEVLYNAQATSQTYYSHGGLALANRG
jgi:hypothetical protein